VTRATAQRRLLKLTAGRRLGNRYVGICTRTQHLAILTSGKGTYCRWHRYRLRRELNQPERD
jgi:hypothetical protein